MHLTNSSKGESISLATCCPGPLVLDLCFYFKMAFFLPGVGYPHFCNPPFRLLVLHGSFLEIVLELELPLLWLRKASLVISSGRWVAGQATCTCYMCATWWRPSFWSRQGFPSRYRFHLFLGQGWLWSCGIVQRSGHQ